MSGNYRSENMSEEIKIESKETTVEVTEAKSEQVESERVEVSVDQIVTDTSKKAEESKKVVEKPEKPRSPTRKEIIKKYKGKMCCMSRAYPCTIHMCALSKCYRVQDLEKTEPVQMHGTYYKPVVRSNEMNRAIAALDRRISINKK